MNRQLEDPRVCIHDSHVRQVISRTYKKAKSDPPTKNDLGGILVRDIIEPGQIGKKAYLALLCYDIVFFC